MGYTTYFDGRFNIEPTLRPEHRVYLEHFHLSRRMKRDAAKTVLIPDKARKATRLPIGLDGGYFVGAQDNSGQAETVDVVDFNSPGGEQPSLWCDWQPNEEGTAIVGPEEETKFYEYEKWIEYLIEHFLAPWGYNLNGEVTWSGEEDGDIGKIRVEHNLVKIYPGKVVFGDGSTL